LAEVFAIQFELHIYVFFFGFGFLVSVLERDAPIALAAVTLLDAMQLASPI